MNVSMQFPPILVWLAAVSTGSILLAAGFTWLARRQSAAWRHFFWLMALAAPLLAGLLSVIPLRFTLPVLPRVAEVAASASTPQADLPPVPPAEPAAASASHSYQSATLPATRQPAINLWLAVWACGMAGAFITLAWSRLRLARTFRRGTLRRSDALQRRLDALRKSAGYQRDVEVKVSSEAAVPFCFGWLRPMVIFPETWVDWPEERQDVALRHEFAHIRRGDLFALALARWCCLICWFNPLVRWAAERLRDEAEQAADDLVLAGPAPASRYAAHLVALAEDCRAALLPPSYSLSMARPNRLSNRIHAILDTGVRRETPAARNLLAISLFAIVATTAGMTVRLTAASPELPAGPSLANFKPEDRSTIWGQAYEMIYAGDTKGIKALLARGLDPNAKLSAHSSMLFVAVDANEEEIVKLLLASGADVNSKTSWGDTAFRRACWRGNKAIADRLVAAGAPKDELLYATGTGDVATLASRDKAQPIADKDTRNLLTCAVVSGHTDTFDWLWEKLALRDEAEKKKLLGEYFVKAAEWGQPGMLRHLETRGALAKDHVASAVSKAANRNHPEVVEYLLKTETPTSETRSRNGSLLRDAAGEGQIQIVKALLDQGADIDWQDEQGNTSLMWAAYNTKSDVCLLLLARGANIHLRNKQGENAAWFAASGAHCPELLEELIKRGVDLKGTDTSGQGLLHAMMHFVPPRPGKIGFPGKVYSEAEAREYDARERKTIDLLIAAGLDVNERHRSETPLMTALGTGHNEAARALLDNGADVRVVNEHGRSALVSAFNIPPLPVDVFERILKARGEADPMTSFYTPAGIKLVPLLGEAIYYAANTNYEAGPIREAVKAMLANGATFPGVKDTNSQHLLQAAARGDLPAVQAAIRGGAPVDAADDSGWTALAISVSLGYDKSTEWLLQNGASVEARGRRSAVDLAIRSDRPDLAEKLLTKGAKVASLDQSLFFAAKQNNQRLVEVLIGLGANVSSDGGTSVAGKDGKFRRIIESLPLYYCIRNGNAQMAKAFLEKGAAADPANLSGGNSLLHAAVNNNQPEIVKLLIEYGANPENKNDRGESPLDFAKKQRKDLVPLIEEARKNVRPEVSRT